MMSSRPPRSAYSAQFGRFVPKRPVSSSGWRQLRSDERLSIWPDITSAPRGKPLIIIPMDTAVLLMNPTDQSTTLSPLMAAQMIWKAGLSSTKPSRAFPKKKKRSLVSFGTTALPSRKRPRCWASPCQPFSGGCDKLGSSSIAKCRAQGLASKVTDMSVETVLDNMLVEWDESRQQGEGPTAERLCETYRCPELVAEMRNRIAAMKATDWMFQEGEDEPDCLSLPTVNWTWFLRDDDPVLPPSSISYDEFAARASQSSLVPSRVLSLLQSVMPEDKPRSAHTLACELIRWKRLSVYQASVLLEGRPVPLILGDYEILDWIGAGGMGEVFKAQHRRMKRVVALKVLAPALVEKPGAIHRFEREIEVVAKLSHPNIVTAYDAREDNGQHFLITEFVDGQTLLALVRKNGPLPVQEGVDYVRQVARGLEYAHHKGVVHRDIKPANLMLDQEGTVKILDLGLAHLESPLVHCDTPTQSQLTKTEDVMGTLDYMAPEQAISTKSADHRADIYSLGCTLCFLLAGKSVYGGKTPMERLVGHRESPIPSLRTARTDVPEGLDAIFQKMLAKKPENRYPTMTAVIEALDAVVVGHEPSTLTIAPQATSAETEGAAVAETLTYRTDREPSQKPQPKPRRWRVAVGLALGLLFVGVVVAGVIFKIKTSGGTVVLECNPSELDGAVVSIDGEEKITITTDEKSEFIRIRVDKGRRKLEVVKGGFKTFTDEFEIGGGEKRPIKVHLEPVEAGPPVAQAAPTAGANPDRRAAEWVLRRGGRLCIAWDGKSKWIEGGGRKQTTASAASLQGGPSESKTVAGEAKRTPLDPLSEIPSCPFKIKNIDILNDKSLGDEVFPLLDGLPELYGLAFEDTAISDAGLKRLAETFPSSKIGWLNVNRTNITDYGLPHIASHRYLGCLFLAGTKITDRGMEHIAKLSELIILDVGGTGVGDAGVKHLQSLKILNWLYLGGTRITDDALGALTGLPSLGFLNISGTRVSDDGLKHIGKLTVLWALEVQNAQITDAGLKHLYTSKNLRHLVLNGNKVTADGVKALKVALPKCNIGWEPPAGQSMGTTTGSAKPPATPAGPKPPLAIAPFDAIKAKQHQEGWGKYLGIPVAETNSVGMKLVLIPPGEFEMGSTPDQIARAIEEGKKYTAEQRDLERVSNEALRHPVEISKPFYLGVYKVTQAEYEQVVGSNPSQSKGDVRQPVGNVSWFDAVAFCNRLSERERLQPYYKVDGEKVAVIGGTGYRLPTEAEWEHSCRAGTTTKWNFGDDGSILSDYAWYVGNSGNTTHKVGEKKPNQWGLYDMHGNVHEWCWDWGNYKYEAKSVKDPMGLSEGEGRVLRGGAFGDPSVFLRSSRRGSVPPRNRAFYIGFRLARTFP